MDCNVYVSHRSDNTVTRSTKYLSIANDKNVCDISTNDTTGDTECLQTPFRSLETCSKRCRIQQSSDLSQASAICASVFLQVDDGNFGQSNKKKGPFLKVTMGGGGVGGGG